MPKAKAAMQVRVIKERQQAPVQKAETPTQITTQEARNAGDWITPVNDMLGLEALLENSSGVGRIHFCVSVGMKVLVSR